MKGKTYLIYYKIAIYPTSVVLSAIYVCIRLAHIIGQLAYVSTQPIIDKTKYIILIFLFIPPTCEVGVHVALDNIFWIQYLN